MGMTGATISVAADADGDAPRFTFDRDSEALVLILGGDWVMAHGAPDMTAARVQLAGVRGVTALRFDAVSLGRWDTILPSFLVRILRLAGEAGLEVDLAGLPEGAARLVRLATAVPERNGGGARTAHGFVERVGLAAIGFGRNAADLLAFVGETSVAGFQLARGRALVRSRDFWLAVQQAGVDALPIVTLISVLIGMIQAFVGGTQLAVFGAQIYVANLVAIGMAREMGAMMAAVIMAGRTGAAYAAELGTMQVNEEIDALRTLGISPIEFLVLPRLLALALMLPLLAIYANLFGMLGGAVVGVGLFDLSVTQYYQQSLQFIGLHDFAAGLIKAVVFGILVAATGCLQGIRSGRDAAAVGAATTAAVVSGIVAVIVADCALNVIYHAIGL
jgi:phospholipid/cholesterol/gamma-HCH transport system permease protein